MLLSKTRLAYRWEGGVYLNVTNRCPTACVFCAKFNWDWSWRGHNLRLDADPTQTQLWRAAERLLREQSAEEIVFCGYGEPTMRLELILELAKRLRPRAARLRLNTIGLGSAAAGRDIVPELAQRFDAVSVSLNTADPAQWRRLHRPSRRWANDGFDKACRFVAGCAKTGLHTTVTAVDYPGVDTWAVAALAADLGAGYRLRPELDSSAAATGGW